MASGSPSTIRASISSVSSVEVPLYPWGNVSEEEFYAQRGVNGTSSYFTSSRGLRLFTRSWSKLTPGFKPKALIFMLHGYSNTISWSFQLSAVSLAEAGYATFAMDIEGHGLSGGLPGFFPDADLFAADFSEFANACRNADLYQGLPCFLFGESLGGGICLLTHLKNPSGWDGAILVAPMCRISDNIKPPWPLPSLLTFFARIGPTWPIVPSKEIASLSFRDPVKRELAMRNPRRYSGKPRLGTARELVRLGDYLSARLPDVSLPFIVLHGDSDVVTDPAVSKALYESAKSPDKTFKLYEGMLHALLQGEPDECSSRVFSDIKQWLDERVDQSRTDGANGDT